MTVNITLLGGNVMKDLLKKKEKAFPYLMCLPVLLLFTLFITLPFINGLWISFHRWDGFSPMKWIGLKNYRFVLTDEIFWKAISNTFIYAFFVTLIKNIIGLGLAIILAKKIRFRTAFRTAVYMPVTFSYVVVGILWVWILNPNFGLLNHFLRALGLDFLIRGWLSEPRYALASVIGVDIWKWIGFHMVLYLAGIQAIPKQLYEAAEIDGASAWQRFCHVTIPQLNSTIIVNVLLSITGAFVANYDIVKLMTDGGPFHSTEVSLTYIVSTAFRYSSVGKANAMSMILFLLVLVFGLLQLKIMTREDVYE